MSNGQDKPCGAVECQNRVGPKGAKGYCSKHYHRLMRHGDPNIMVRELTRQSSTCSMDDCSTPPRARNLCAKHYMRWRSHGDPTVVKAVWDTRKRVNIWDRVLKTDTHWYWNGYKDKKGYGWLSGRPAHVLVFEAVKGPIPLGMQLDHLCRIHDCVNPDCLEPVTQQENIDRGFGIPVLNRAKTRCPQNHPYDDLNTYVDPSGGRRCRQCARDRYQAKKAAAAASVTVLARAA